jgi:peptidyl-prolyl cis-trans isomerase B (cyclophilin B)
VAGKKERQRRLARERYQRRTVRQAQRARRARQWTISVLAAVAVAGIAVGSVFLAARSSSPSAAATPSASATSTPTPTPSVSPTPTPTPVAEPAHHCTYTASGTAARKVNLPAATPNYKASYSATINTNLGSIVIDLLNSKATCTVNSFISLAAQNYFSHTSCHRLTTASSLYVLQCGDPTGTGAGGPGYEFANENLTGATYMAGTVAMAHSSAPNSNGSQFFVVYKNSTLPPSYTPFGTIVSGLNIIQKVAKVGSDNSNGPGDGHPKDKVDIESVTIKKT